MLIFGAVDNNKLQHNTTHVLHIPEAGSSNVGGNEGNPSIMLSTISPPGNMESSYIGLNSIPNIESVQHYYKPLYTDSNDTLLLLMPLLSFSKQLYKMSPLCFTCVN